MRWPRLFKFFLSEKPEVDPRSADPRSQMLIECKRTADLSTPLRFAGFFYTVILHVEKQVPAPTLLQRRNRIGAENERSPNI
jgi:hypothetical protein